MPANITPQVEALWEGLTAQGRAKIGRARRALFAAGLSSPSAALRLEPEALARRLRGQVGIGAGTIALIQDHLAAPNPAKHWLLFFTGRPVDRPLLSPDEREVLERHYGLRGFRPQTLELAAQALGVTRARAHQLEHQALARLDKLQRHVAAGKLRRDDPLVAPDLALHAAVVQLRAAPETQDRLAHERAHSTRRATWR